MSAPRSEADRNTCEKADRDSFYAENLIAENLIAEILFQLEMLEAGLAVRAHGLIYFLPLCHDAYGEGNA